MERDMSSVTAVVTPLVVSRLLGGELEGSPLQQSRRDGTI